MERRHNAPPVRHDARDLARAATTIHGSALPSRSVVSKCDDGLAMGLGCTGDNQVHQIRLAQCCGRLDLKPNF